MFNEQDHDLMFIETILDELLTPPERFEKSSVWQAARYSALGGGKRIRPLLHLMTCRMFRSEIPDGAYHFAAAIEMIHTYSLIHDDLPSMDNDDFRRGQLSCHKVFGEGIAIIAGDLLLNRAYETMLHECVSSKKKGYLRAMSAVAKAAGGQGMVLGQDLDLSMEKKDSANVTIHDVETMARLKTGALIATAIESAAHICGAPKKTLDELIQVGQHIGLAFQIRDDILDGIDLSDQFGKTRHKDERDDKKTFVTVAGLENAKMYLQEHSDAAIQSLDRLEKRGLKTNELTDLTRHLMERTY